MSTKTYQSENWPINKLKPWDQNPRGIMRDRFEELKQRLNRWGQTKPLIVNQEGIVCGGNMRLAAMKELGYSEVWVSVVDAPTDKDIFEQAMNDNEEFGFYEKQEVAELASKFALDEDELSRYHIHLDTAKPLDELMSQFGGPSKDRPEIELTPELLESHNYVVFIFNNKLDWQVVCDDFAIKPVKTPDSTETYERAGIGRVKDGKLLIERLKSG